MTSACCGALLLARNFKYSTTVGGLSEQTQCSAWKFTLSTSSTAVYITQSGLQVTCSTTHCHPHAELTGVLALPNSLLPGAVWLISPCTTVTVCVPQGHSPAGCYKAWASQRSCVSGSLLPTWNTSPSPCSRRASPLHLATLWTEAPARAPAVWSWDHSRWSSYTT